MIILDLNQVEETLKQHDERLKKIEEQLLNGGLPIKKGKEKSIKEFILEKNPKGAYNIGIAIAYYLENNAKMSSFNCADVEQGFRDAKEVLPKNIRDLMYKNTKKGYFMEAKELKDNLKAYVLTSSGEKLVENNFEKSSKK